MYYQNENKSSPFDLVVSYSVKLVLALLLSMTILLSCLSKWGDWGIVSCISRAIVQALNSGLFILSFIPICNCCLSFSIWCCTLQRGSLMFWVDDADSWNLLGLGQQMGSHFFRQAPLEVVVSSQLHLTNLTRADRPANIRNDHHGYDNGNSL